MFRRKKAETTYELLVDGNKILVTRKRIKTLRLKVNTVTKKIRVSCPYRVSEKELIDFVQFKRSWIEKHLSKKIPSAKKELSINYVEGERLPFRGEE